MELSIKLTVLAITLIAAGLVVGLTFGLLGIASKSEAVIDIDGATEPTETTSAPTEWITETTEWTTEPTEWNTDPTEWTTQPTEWTTETTEWTTETTTETVETTTTTPEFESYFEPGLRIRFDITFDVPDALGNTFFINIPRELASALEEGWTQVQRSSEAFYPSLSMYCKDGDLTLCPLYDDANYISGLQINIAVDELQNPPFSPATTGWQLWSVLAADGTTRDYWVNQQYFLSPESVNLSVDDRIELRSSGETLVDGAVWVAHTDGTLLRVSSHVPYITVETLYTEQTCVPLMGGHHYYNMSASLDCEAEGAVHPWFTLFQDDTLLGTGLMAFGTYPDVTEDRTFWFERPAWEEVQMIVPYAPECLYDLADNGLVTMHIYYINEPWTITC